MDTFSFRRKIMGNRFLGALAAAVFLGFGVLPVHAQTDRASSATSAGSAAPGSSTSAAREGKRRDAATRRNAANSTGRDLSDGDAAGASSSRPPSASSRTEIKPAPKIRDKGDTSRDLSDGSTSVQPSVGSASSTATSAKGLKRHAGAKGGDGANATGRDLSDGSADTSAIRK